MKKLLVVFFTLSLINIFPEEIKIKNKLKFSDYMKIIEEKLPDLRQNEIALLKAKNNLSKSYSAYDATLNASFSGIGKKIYPDGNPTEVDYSAGFQGAGAFNSTLPSGTRLTLGAGYTQYYTWGKTTYDYSRFGQPKTEEKFIATTWDPVIKIGVAQLLVYNWFGFLDRFAVKDAKMKLQIEELQKDENDIEIKNYYKKLYFLWYQWDKMLSFMEKTIDNAAKLEAQTLDKLRNQVAENDEYQRAKYSVYKYDEHYKLIKIEYQNILNELSNLFDPTDLIPEENEFNTNYGNSMHENVLYIDFEKTRTGKIFSLNKENLEYLKKIRENQMLPQVNLFGNIDIKFHQYRNDPKEDSSSGVSYKSSNGDVDFTTGIEFVYPLGNFKARADVKEMDLLIKEIVYQHEIMRNKYSKGMKSIVDTIEAYKTIIKNKEAIIDSLRSRYKTERVKYSQARLELYSLLESENLMTSEEIDLMKTQVGMIMLYFDYLKLINSDINTLKIK